MKHSRLILALLALAFVVKTGSVHADWRPTNVVTSGAFVMTASGPVPASNGVIHCNATNGAVNYTLPPSTGNTDYVTVIKIDSTANACTPVASGTDTIHNSGAAVLSTQYAYVKLQSSALGVWSIVAGGSSAPSSSSTGIYTSANLTGTDTVTFAQGTANVISTLTANETLTLADSRTSCSTTNRCRSTHMLCQNATGNFTVTWSNSNINWLNAATAPAYPLTASGAGANCVNMYFEYNGTSFDEVGQSAFFAGP